MNSIAERIKESISMDSALERYGFPVSKNKRIPCPLHNGHDDNFAYTDHYFKCFVCGCSGDVISFVMQLFGISFSQALLRINLDFGLGFSNKKPDRRETIRLSAEKAEKEMEKQRRDQYLAILTECHRRLWNTRLAYRPKSPEEAPCPQFVHALKETDRLEYLLEEVLSEMR